MGSYYECSVNLSINLASIPFGVIGHSKKISCFSSTIHTDFHPSAADGVVRNVSCAVGDSHNI